jgi:hypothetical protein
MVVIADIWALLSLIPDDATTSSTIDEFLNEIGRHRSDAIRAPGLSLEQSQRCCGRQRHSAAMVPHLKAEGQVSVMLRDIVDHFVECEGPPGPPRIVRTKAAVAVEWDTE